MTDPVEINFEANAKEAISHYLGALDDVETRHLDTSNPEGFSDSHFFRRESQAETVMLASLALLSDEQVETLLKEQPARDYDGSTFVVSNLARVRAWQGEKTREEVIALLASTADPQAPDHEAEVELTPQTLVQELKETASVIQDAFRFDLSQGTGQFRQLNDGLSIRERIDRAVAYGQYRELLDITARLEGRQQAAPAPPETATPVPSKRVLRPR